MDNEHVAGIRFSLAGPAQLRAAAVDADGPDFDIDDTLFRLTLKNVGARPITLPFDELRRNVARVYTNLATGAVHEDNETPPPTKKGLVETLAPGESREIILQFQFPDEIAEIRDEDVDLRFCARWQSDWLRSQYYRPGSYEWNESFEVCAEIRITPR